VIGRRKKQTAQPARTGSPAAVDTPSYRYVTLLLAIVDGDTIHAEIRLGCDVRTRQTIRFYGVNAPEMSTAAGVASKEFVVRWFADNAPDGLFTLETVKDKREKYGRYLGILYANGRSLNDDLVAAGMAVPYFP
jgi:micrococcal nuclease